MNKVKNLSCYIRTQDEERMIGDVLNQVLKLTDDIVIVDSGSTDRTREVVESKGALFISQPWLGNGYQKLVGEHACKNDWVLDLDADELLSDELVIEIQKVFDDEPNPLHVFSMPLITVPPYGEIWHKTNVDPRNKLYNRTAYSMPKHKAWDQLELDNSVKVFSLSGALYHYSFPNVAHMIAKINKGSSSRANNAKLKPFPLVVTRILFAIPIYFLKHYLQKGLWRAGLYGFSISMVAAFGRWLRDVKMLEVHLEKQGKRNKGYE